jgi:hypothetical protein
MRTLASITAVGLVVVLGALANDASAQYKGKSRPFDTTSRRPAVSPYMNLLNNNTGAATNYQSLVRPQIDQQNYNAQSASAIKNLQRQQAKSSQRSKSGSEGNQKLRSTGHAATRETYSHFYPSLGR